MNNLKFQTQRVLDLAGDCRFPWNFHRWPNFAKNQYQSGKKMNFAITFDVEENYPDRSTNGIENSVAKIAEILKKNNIPATFFVQGSIISKIHALLRQLASSGHELGLHGFNHNNWGNAVWFWDEVPLSYRQKRNDLIAARENFSVYGLPEQKTFRAPNMNVNFETLKLLREFNFTSDSSWPSFRKPTNNINGTNPIKEIPVTSVPRGRIFHMFFPTFDFEVFNWQNVLLMDVNKLNYYLNSTPSLPDSTSCNLVFLAHPWEFYSNKFFPYCSADNFSKLENFFTGLKDGRQVNFLTISQLATLQQ